MQVVLTQEKISWSDLTHELGKEFAAREAETDLNGEFVEQNYLRLKEHRYFAALVPKELGGEGMSYQQMADILRILAHYSPSTALALSMHQHLVAANVWKYRLGKGGEPVLRKVADKQVVLVSTGAGDWLSCNGNMIKVEGGYRVSATKHFASQSAIADVMVTSAVYNDPDNGPQVLHFPVPFNAEGVTVMDNWNTLGMRGTGSHSIKMEHVFVADEVIALTRLQGEFHPVWNVVLTVAMPLIMAVYVGIAERAAEIALDCAKRSQKSYTLNQIGAMNNELVTCRVMLQDMLRLCNNFDFQPVNSQAHEILSRKTVVAKTAMKTVQKAVEIVGGQSFFRSSEIEQLFRDVQAAQYHPLQEREQEIFCGEYLLNG
ncbi:MAG: acyl-CoA dehydrogenase family protein [Calditrichota bacterium]